MAKLIVTVDTETNELNVTVNGQSIDNVNYVSAQKYPEDDEYYNGRKAEVHFNINSFTQGEDDVKVNTCVYAAKAAKNDGDSKLADDVFVSEEQGTPAEIAVQKWYKMEKAARRKRS